MVSTGSADGRKLAGRKAVVIGGTGGIGSAMSLALAEAGAHVFVTGGRSLPRLESLLERIRGIGGSADGELLAIDTPADVSSAAELAANADILVVAYGPFLQKPLAETEADDWGRMALLDLALPGSCVSSALPGMVSRGYGRIVLFGGTGTDLPRAVETNCAYAAAKAGLSTLVKSVAASFGPKNVAALLICPGFTDTEYLSPDEKRELEARMPGGRLINTGEIAGIGVEFVTQERAVVNGASLSVDCGKKY
jgi:NAD(P)-dependent dehydrogenase (short-subunit alcohol dehydrogenase family)